MKRKLDENDEPVDSPNGLSQPSFESFNLDPRLLQATQELKYVTPTDIQAAAIPLALDGKDVLGQAKTGSGKTAAYLLPLVQSALEQSTPTTTSLILVPTRDLADQVFQAISTLTKHCSGMVKTVNLTRKQSDTVIQASLQQKPQIVVSTPTRARHFISSGDLSLQDIRHLVVDEADLVLSYGYEADMKLLSTELPRGLQTMMMSATVTEDIETLKTLFCRSPVLLKLEDETDDGILNQYAVKCGEDEKFLLVFVMFKLKLVRGKTIIFVADIDRSYRLKLYLEQFGIRSCVLNAELPINSRLHVVQEFNKNVYDIIIAADDREVAGGTSETSERPDDASAARRKNDFGVSRGIDFQNVACVLNFDLPSTSKSYTHRIGRTARAGQTGMALSFVVPRDLFGKHKPTSTPTAKNDEKVLAKIIERQAKHGKEVKPYNFDMSQVDAFRYRMNDALRNVTRHAVREFRAREIKMELLKSEKMKKHFEENPEDLRHLRHDQSSQIVRSQPHLHHVPDYLMPAKGRKGLTKDEIGFIGLQNHAAKKLRGRKRVGGKQKRPAGQSDPLKSFKARRK